MGRTRNRNSKGRGRGMDGTIGIDGRARLGSENTRTMMNVLRTSRGTGILCRTSTALNALCTALRKLLDGPDYKWSSYTEAKM